MRIVSIYECPISGGLDRLFIHLVKNWPNVHDTWEIYQHVCNSGREMIEEELKENAEFHVFSHGVNIAEISQELIKKGSVGRMLAKFVRIVSFPFLMASQYFYFRGLYKRRGVDIVYLHQGGHPGSYAEHMAGLAARHSRNVKKVILSIQNLPSKREKKLFCTVLDKLVNSYADHIIVASHQTHQEYLKTGLDRGRLQVIPEGVSVNETARQFSTDERVVKIGIIATFEERKGHRILWEACALLKNKGIKNFKILAFGQQEFGEFAQIVEAAENLGILDVIEFKGYERDMDQLYGPLDIVVQTSIDKESMPLVPIDAAAYYKPVVASRFQGTIDVIEEGKTGLLFKKGNPLELADKLQTLIADKNLRERMGLAARARYEQKYTAAIMAQEYIRVFEGYAADQKTVGV